MNIMIVSHAYSPDVKTGQGNNIVKFLNYGGARIGFRADVFILLEPPMNEREEEWLKYTKHACRPNSIYINPKGEITQPYAENANDY